MKEHRQAQDEFYQSNKEDDEDIESKKPAMFRKSDGHDREDGKPQ